MAKKNSPIDGIKLDIRAINPDPAFGGPLILGIDALPADVNDPSYDENRLELLDESDEEMQRLLTSMRATGSFPGIATVRETDVIVEDNEAPQGTTPPATKCLVVHTARRRAWALRVINSERAEAGLAPILMPVTMAEGDALALHGQRIGENEFRVNNTMPVKARDVVKLLASGATEAQAAELYRVDVATIKNWEAFAHLTEPVQELVEMGDLPAATALQLKGLSPEDQEHAAKRLVKEAKTTVAHGRAEANKVRQSTNDAGDGDTGSARSRGTTTIVAPAKRLVMELADMHTAGSVDDVDDSDAFFAGVKWAAGLLATEEVGGLAEAVERAEAAIKERRSKRKAPAAMEPAAADEQATSDQVDHA